jgi:hypothetical protein
MAIHVVVDGPPLCANKTPTAAVFAAQVSSQGERHLVEEFLRLVVILDFNAVVGMDARAAEVTIPIAERVFPHTVVVEDQ